MRTEITTILGDVQPLLKNEPVILNDFVENLETSRFHLFFKYHSYFEKKGKYYSLDEILTIMYEMEPSDCRMFIHTIDSKKFFFITITKEDYPNEPGYNRILVFEK